jgi:hypothetical protein
LRFMVSGLKFLVFSFQSLILRFYFTTFAENKDSFQDQFH